MELTRQKNNDLCVIKIKGKLDTGTTPKLDTELMGAINSGETKIVMDFKDLDYISSAGLRVLLLGAKMVKNSGSKIILCGMQEHVKQVFDIAGFTGLFTIYENLNEAVNS